MDDTRTDGLGAFIDSGGRVGGGGRNHNGGTGAGRSDSSDAIDPSDADVPDAHPEADSRANVNRWAIVWASSAVHALHAACVYLGPATLMSPMRRDLGLSVAEISLPLNAYRAVNAALLVPVGAVLDRIGPQTALRVSILLAAVMGLLFPLCNALPQLVVLQILFAVTKLFGGLTAMLLLISRAFGSRKGFSSATGILLSGYSLAGFLAPAVVGALCDAHGWRVAAGALSVLFLTIGVPLTWAFLREPKDTYQPVPSSTASRISSSDSNEQGNESDSSERSQTGHEPLFPRNYIALMAIVFAFSSSMHIVLDHYLVFLREDFGLPFDVATRYISILNLCALFAKLAIGPLGDRYDKNMLMAVFGCIGAVASTLLLSYSSGVLSVTTSALRVLLFAPLYAIGYAGTFSLTTSALPEYGRKKLAFRSNMNMMLLFLSGSISSYVAGLWRTSMGSYALPFALNAGVWLVVVVGALLNYLSPAYGRPRAAALAMAKPNRSE